MKNNEEIFLVFNASDKDDMEVWQCEFPKGGETEDDAYTTWRYDE